jgi:hypothetical protein
MNFSNTMRWNLVIMDQSSVMLEGRCKSRLAAAVSKFIFLRGIGTKAAC